MEWARSYAKLSGALDSPRGGLFVLSNLGKRILSLPPRRRGEPKWRSSTAIYAPHAVAEEQRG